MEISDPALFAMIVSLVLACTVAGIARGRRVRRERRPDTHHLGTIQSAMLGLLALLLGFAFAGAMSRFIERQDALGSEANAIETAYGRAALLPTCDEIRAAIREYAQIRVALFSELEAEPAAELTKQMLEKYDRALAATLEGVREAPQFAVIAVPGIEALNNEFSVRNAIARRELPGEFLGVMLLASCVAMATIGFGVGLADQRSVASVLALSFLVATTLFVTLDFDRTRQGLVRLDPAPFHELLARIAPVT